MRALLPNARSRTWVLEGGLDTESPAVVASPKTLRDALNYEQTVTQGYARIQGHEVFDGRRKPSEASFWKIPFDAGTDAISDGDVISNVAAPGANDPQAEVLVNAVVESGSFGTNDAAGYVIVMAVSGAALPTGLSDDDPLYISGVQHATQDGALTERDAPDDSSLQTWLRDAIETTRAKIGKVPGDGPLRGIHVYDVTGDVYAFRDNAEHTECKLYEATSSGWSVVDLGETLDFTNGTVAFTEGDTITGGNSGATATIERVVTTSGTFGACTAIGYFVLSSVGGGPFQDAEPLSDPGGGTATASGANTAITLQPGGRYEIINRNFFGTSAARRAYGVDGANPAFEFDGSAFVQVRSTMSPNTPKHVGEFKKHLFMAFPNGSVQHGSIGNPYIVNVITGASEIATGDEITGFQVLPGGAALLIGNRNHTYVLYGTSVADWQLDQYSDKTGVIEWSLQRIATALYADDRGLVDMRATPKFDNFQDATFSRMVTSAIVAKIHSVSASCIVRAKNQYRIFFTDGTGYYVTFKDGKVSGILPVDLGKVVRCISSEEDSSGKEVIYFGSDDGYVYQLDKGTSFNGSAISAYIEPHYNHIGSPETLKKFVRAVVDLDVESSDAAGDLSFTVTPKFAYGKKVGVAQTIAADESQDTPKLYVKPGGNSASITLRIASSHTYENPHTLSCWTLEYWPTRAARGGE